VYRVPTKGSGVAVPYDAMQGTGFGANASDQFLEVLDRRAEFRVTQALDRRTFAIDLIRPFSKSGIFGSLPLLVAMPGTRSMDITIGTTGCPATRKHGPMSR
jgi:hypothetical protein